MPTQTITSIAFTVLTFSLCALCLTTNEPAVSTYAFADLNPEPQSSATAQAKAVATEEPAIKVGATLESPIKSGANSRAWPVDVINSLNDLHHGHEDAIRLISRAIDFDTFAALPLEQADRLVRYAQAVRDSSGGRILHLCWGHDTAPQIVTAFKGVRALALLEANEPGTPLPVFQALPSDRWSWTATDGNTGNLGTSVTITWSFVPDGTHVPNGEKDAQGNKILVPSDLISKMNTAYGVPNIPGDLTTAPWFPIFVRAFASWELVTGNTYIYEPNDGGATFPDFRGGMLGVRGDVRIGGTRIDGNSGTLAFNYFPDYGDMVIDSDDSSNLAIGQETLFENTLAHEHGHGLGFDHVCPVDETKLMEPFVTEDFIGPQFDDLLTAQGLYGDPLETKTGSRNNETPITAYDLGELDGVYVENALISISRSNDVDVYRFEVDALRELNVTVTPTTAVPYLEGEQNENGCTAGTLFDPSMRQSLSVRILDTDGATVLGFANGAGLGQAETLNGIQLLQTGQSYYLEVSGGGENGGDLNNAQVYQIQLEFINPSEIQLGNFTLIDESCLPANGFPDPGEWVTASIQVQNVGVETKTDISVSLAGESNLSLLGSAEQTISSLVGGASTVLSFSFKLDGECRDETSITFQASSGLDQVELLSAFILGGSGITFSENVDSVAPGGLPTGFEQSSPVSAGNWVAISASASSPPNSMYSPGAEEVNSAILISPTFMNISADVQLQFDHDYRLESFNGEENYDGAILEISIANGSWQEWTAAGGAFLANGYNGVIDARFGNPLAGQSGWVDDSGGFIQTTATFPPSAVGQDVRVRWHQGNDSEFSDAGWWIDNIQLIETTCCESQVPELSVSALSPSLEEFGPLMTTDFVVTSGTAVANSVNVAYTLAGDAVAGADFIALAGSATIDSGLSMVAIPVTVIVDSVIEGDELVTLMLSPSINYGIGTASASITIEDLPFDAYRFEAFGNATVNVGDAEDFDFDGLANLLEYAFRLDAARASTLPFSLLVNEANEPELQLSYYEDTRLEDINYIVETSTTLMPESWTTEGVTLSDGIEIDGIRNRTASIPVADTPGFIRIRIERISP